MTENKNKSQDRCIEDLLASDELRNIFLNMTDEDVKACCTFDFPSMHQSNNSAKRVKPRKISTKKYNSNDNTLFNDEILKSMRDFTDVENKNYNGSLDKIYKSTGINIYRDLYDDEQLIYNKSITAGAVKTGVTPFDIITDQLAVTRILCIVNLLRNSQSAHLLRKCDKIRLDIEKVQRRDFKIDEFEYLSKIVKIFKKLNADDINCIAQYIIN